jgi:hypothetical protein
MTTHNYYKKYLKYKNKYLELKGGKITDDPVFNLIESIGFEFETNDIIILINKPDNSLDYLPQPKDTLMPNTSDKYSILNRNIKISDELIISYDHSYNFLTDVLELVENGEYDINFKQIPESENNLTLNYDSEFYINDIDTEFIVTFAKIEASTNIIMDTFILA